LREVKAMGMRQMTFEIPEELAERFVSEVPESEQSAEVTKQENADGGAVGSGLRSCERL
jgi:hypothetical protein